ncbi:hypothetical protein SALBM217S_07088 [Streptomyces griseoloalbus]
MTEVLAVAAITVLAVIAPGADFATVRRTPTDGRRPAARGHPVAGCEGFVRNSPRAPDPRPPEWFSG